MFLVRRISGRARRSLGERNDVTCVSMSTSWGSTAAHGGVLSSVSATVAIGWLIGDECEGMRNMFTMMKTAGCPSGCRGSLSPNSAYHWRSGHALERAGKGVWGAPPANRARSSIIPTSVGAHDAAGLDRRHAAVCSTRTRPPIDGRGQHDPAERQRWRRSSTSTSPCRKGVQRVRHRDDVTGAAGPWWHGLRRGDRRRAATTAISDRAIYEGTNGSAADLVGRKLAMRAVRGSCSSMLDAFGPDADRVGRARRTAPLR